MSSFNLVETRKRPPLKTVEKTWGAELWFANNETSNYCGKILKINKGHRFSMHFHDRKVETFFILKGKLQVWLIDTTTSEVHNGFLVKGDCLDIERLLPHEVEAVEDTQVIEVSTFHRDEDSFRVWRTKT